jgi:predicted Fe-Mo cluster-binding NifX family protein
MKIALTICDGRVSPIFETSREVLIIALDAGQETSRTLHLVDGDSTAHRIRWLADEGVNVLICGGIMTSITEMLHAAGVGVVDRARGTVDEALMQYRSQSGRIH